MSGKATAAIVLIDAPDLQIMRPKDSRKTKILIAGFILLLVISCSLTSVVTYFALQSSETATCLKSHNSESRSSSVSENESWQSWKAEHGKYYGSLEDEEEAAKRYLEVETIIAEHNAQNLSYTVSHNEFSDKPLDEVHAPGIQPQQNPVKPYIMHDDRRLSELPSSVDWVSEGAVTAVKKQGLCGSCWSFATSGALEGAYEIATGHLVPFSEQFLVSCDSKMYGCEGGMPADAMAWMKTYGDTTESRYPYTSGAHGETGKCDTSKDVPYVINSGYAQPVTEEQLQHAVATKGPVAIAIHVDCCGLFQHYSSGVIPSSSTCSTPDHAVLVVGYGTDSEADMDYWKVKNSWGTTWGESGYFRIARGSNACSMMTTPAAFPTGVGAYDSNSNASPNPNAVPRVPQGSPAPSPSPSPSPLAELELMVLLGEEYPSPSPTPSPSPSPLAELELKVLLGED